MLVEAVKDAFSTVAQPVYVIDDGRGRMMIVSSLTSYNFFNDEALVTFNVSSEERNEFFWHLHNAFNIYALNWRAAFQLETKTSLHVIVAEQRNILWTALARTEASVHLFGKHQVIASIQRIAWNEKTSGLVYKNREFTI
jgi:hypothetical protein